MRFASYRSAIATASGATMWKELSTCLLMMASLRLSAATGEITNRGRAELLKTYKAGVELSPRPYIHNHVIELAGPSRATGRCYVELRDASDNLNWLGTGYYDDEYVKVGDTWKFQSRRAQMVHLEPKMKAGITRLQEK
jgi:SnoaL-like domain